MAAVYKFYQPGGIDMGIDLGGGDVGMTQQRLKHSQVCAACEQVRCEGVSQDMRANAVGCDPGQCRHAAHQLEEPNPAEMRFPAGE
jgi:hypothetical protein